MQQRLSAPPRSLPLGTTSSAGTCHTVSSTPDHPSISSAVFFMKILPDADLSLGVEVMKLRVYENTFSVGVA